MKQVCVYERNGWRLTSYGNGWAYLLEDTEGPQLRSAWFQDEDAGVFRDRVMDSDGWLVDGCEERFADYSEVMSNA